MTSQNQTEKSVESESPQNLPKDGEQLKENLECTSVSKEESSENMSSLVPRDKKNLVFIFFYMLGMGSLLPWNIFLSVDKYWMYKLRNATETTNVTELTVNDENVALSEQPLSPLQMKWNSYLSIASMIPNLSVLLLNAAIGHLVAVHPRLIISIASLIALLLFTDVLSLVNTDHWQDQFITVTLTSVVFINVLVAALQGGLSSVAAKFPPSYMGSLVQGQALGGIFAALTSILSLSLASDASTPATISFFIVTLFLVVIFVVFLFMRKSEFYKFYTNPNMEWLSNTDDDEMLSEEGGQRSISPQSENEGFLKGDHVVAKTEQKSNGVIRVEKSSEVSVITVCIDIWIWIITVYLTFLVTLALFPAITFRVESVNYGHGYEWNDKYFTAVGCFLLFNVGDYLGRCLATRVQWPKPTRNGSYIALTMALARFVFIPLFIVCNISPMNRVNSQVLIESDTAYLMIMFLFATSNGYLGLICMMFGPKTLEGSVRQSVAGSVLVSCLVLGLATGSMLSVFCVMAL